MLSKDQIGIRTLVRMREDFQAMRKRMCNRLGLKADGTDQDLKEHRNIREDDFENFKIFAKAAFNQEKEIEKELSKMLKRFSIYNEWLKNVKGIGVIAAAQILGNFDIEKATTVSKMWQYAGLNVGLVPGKIRVEVKKYKKEMGEIVTTYYDDKGKPEEYIVVTNEMIRGDKLTSGFVSPFNKSLRAALLGVMADGFIKCQNEYCMNHYYPYKLRLEQNHNEVLHLKKMVAWKDVTKGHRDRAAKRKMVKEFLKDLYQEWRTIEGLPVRVPYAEEYLGKVHAAG
jgi:hypothetical protein